MHDDTHGHGCPDHHGPNHEHPHVHAHSHLHEHGGECHDHSHEHSHSHPHRHGPGHEHDHGHGGGCGGGNHALGHGSGACAHGQEGGELAKTTALLEYMLGHNRDHAGELGALALALGGAGWGAAAELLSSGVEDFDRGNEKLAQALALIQGGKG